MDDRAVAAVKLLADITPLENPDFRRLWFSSIVTVIGGQLSIVAVPQQIFQITENSSYVGLAGVFALVPLVVFGLWGGALADVMDRRRLIVITTFGLGGTALAFWAQAALHLNNVWLLLVLLGVQQAFFAINQPTRSAILPRLLPGHQLPSANSLSMTVFQFGAIAGPARALPTDRAGDVRRSRHRRHGAGIAVRGHVGRCRRRWCVLGLAARIRRQGLAVIVCIVGWGLAMVGFGVAIAAGSGPVALWIALGFLAIGGGVDMISAALRTTMLQQVATDEVRGRLQGVFIVVVAGGPRIGDLAHGFAAAAVGTAVAAAGGGVLVVIGMVAACVVFPSFLRYRVGRGPVTA